MKLNSSKGRNFFLARTGYDRRLQLVSGILVLGMLFSELLFFKIERPYSAHWVLVALFACLGITFFVAISRLELSKKRMAFIATTMALLGLTFLTVNCIASNFSVLNLGQFLFASIFITFAFERAKYLNSFLIGLSVLFVCTIPYLAFQNENHLFFLLINGFIFLFSIVSFRVKMEWINMLRFSEQIMSSYDRYVVVFNEKGAAVFISPFVLNEFGITMQQMKLNDWWELRGMNVDEIKNIKNSIAEGVKTNKEIPNYKQVITLRNGETKILEWNAQIVDGKYYVGHGTDVTEELNAKREAEKLSKVTEALGAGVIIVNYKGEVTWCNSSYCSIFGYDQSELIGKRPSEVFAVPDFFEERYDKIRKEGLAIGQQLEIPHYHKNGQLIWVLVQSSSFLGELENGSDTIEVVTEITKQKNSELEVKQISLIAERTQTPVLICDNHFIVNWINSALLTEFEFEFEDVIGTDFLSLYAGEWSHNEPIETLIHAAKNRESCQIDIQLEGDSRLQWYKLSMDPIQDDLGKTGQFMLVMQNIQKSKDIQELIEQKNTDMIASISYAKRIQSALLPDEFMLQNNLPPHFFYYRPKDIVSGDFYFAKFHLGKLYIAIADCTGHGVPGAMISSIGAAALNNAIFDRGYSKPGEILEHVDRYLKRTLSASEEGLTDGMDLGLLVFDFDREKLNYSGARRPLIIMNKCNNEQISIPGDRRSIGEFLEDGLEPFSTKSIPIDSDLLLYLFTDGITDQFGGDAYKKIGLRSFLKMINEYAKEEVLEQKELFVEFFNKWTKDYKTEQTDDMLLFVMSVNPEYMKRMKSEINREVTSYEN